MPPLPRTPLLTPRLLLRPYAIPDAEDFFALIQHNRPRLAASFPDRLAGAPTLPAARRVIEQFGHDWRTGRFYVFGIWHGRTAQYLGDICLMPQAAGQAEIGYYLAQHAEGQGYAREALAAICQFGFEAVRAKNLLIRCYRDNERGQAVARAAGFCEPEPPRAFAWFRNSDELGNILRFVRGK